ncbi:MAG TPA: hypothetical protein VFP20_08715, partial [Bacteroidales bacterium]|nr:hypothetical protein [Bacteroidales bacterium]
VLLESGCKSRTFYHTIQIKSKEITIFFCEKTQTPCNAEVSFQKKTVISPFNLKNSTSHQTKQQK